MFAPNDMNGTQTNDYNKESGLSCLSGLWALSGLSGRAMLIPSNYAQHYLSGS